MTQIPEILTRRPRYFPAQCLVDEDLELQHKYLSERTPWVLLRDNATHR